MGATRRLELVGRVAERSILAGRVAELATGLGGLVWVNGEAGIGKTALVDDLAEQARQAGCEVWHGGADELMEAFPLRLMADCLGVSVSSPLPLAVKIARVLRGDDVGGVADAVLAASEWLLELVDTRCAAAPMLLVAEDLHWADEPSLLVWNRLARAVGQIPLLLVGTCRPGPGRPVVQALAGLTAERAGLVLDLGPLSAEEAQRVAAGVVGPLGPGLVRELDRAGGSPFYVRELVEALSRERLLVTGSDGRVDLVSAAGRTPVSLSATVRSRLRFLPEDTLHGLRSAALLGREFSVAEWATVSGRSVTEVVADVQHAVAGAVLEAGGERLRFRHELIRQALVEQTPVGVRAALQGEFARQLAGAGFDIDVVARHLLAAGDPMQPWAVAWLARVPESRMYAALGVSAQLLRRAWASVGAGSAEWQPIAARLARVLFWSGERVEAGPVAEQVIAHTGDLELSVRMRVIATRCAGGLGDFKHAYQVTAVAEQGLPDGWRATLMAWSAMALVFLDEPAQAHDRAVESLRLARQSGDLLAVGYAWNALLACARNRGEYVEIEMDAPPGIDPESLELYGTLLSNQMSLQYALGERAAFERTEARWIAFAERGESGQYAHTAGAIAERCYEAGRWDDALVHADSVAEKIRPGTYQSIALGHPYRIAVRREQPELAARYLNAAGFDTFDDESPAAQRSLFDDLDVCDIRAIQAAARGDREDELRWRRRWLTAPRWAQVASWFDLVRLLYVALDLDDTTTVSAVLDTFRELPDIMPVRLAADCCRALVADDTDELVRIGEQYRLKGWGLIQLDIQEEAAVRLARAGRTDAARTLFTDVLNTYDGLGAGLDIRRVTARMRPYGIRTGTRRPHRRAVTGWAALTPAEQRVARLAAEGLSNPDIARRLFLSRNTIQTHVSSILAKLQLRSRVELSDSIPAA